MRTVYSEKHKLRDAKIEIFEGQIVPPFECPKRAEYILNRIKEVNLGEVIEPRDYGLEPVHAVHNKDYVKLLVIKAKRLQIAGQRAL
jgi:acetoin utilization deacetylase AcuC-like enzyme